MAAAVALSPRMNPDASSMDDRVRRIIQRQAQMETKRALFESQWEEISARVLPRENIFWRNYANSVTEGEKRTERIFSSTAQNALPRFAAVMQSLLTPDGQRWHQVKARRLPGSREPSQTVKAYFEELTEVLFDCRYSPRANFSSQSYEVDMAVGAFGTAAMFVDESVGYSLRYHAVHVVELFIEQNFVGAVDTVHRKFPMTARQMIQKWGKDKCPLNVVRAFEGTTPDSQFDVLHCVYPREDWLPSRKDYKGMPWTSLYIDIQSKTIVEEGGYRTFPYSVRRYVTGPRETYGRSPAMQALPDIKTGNEVRKTLLRAGERAIDPPILLQEDGALQAFSLRSGALNYGGLDPQGMETAKPFISGAQLPEGFNIQEQVDKDINDAFGAQIWQMLTEHPDMTATQVLMIAQQQGMLYGPMMGRQQSEGLGPMIEREIDLLGHAGQLPPPPDELVAMGGLYDIEYTSPLNRLRRADEGTGIINTIQALTPLEQANPGKVLIIFDPQKTAYRLADIYGAPEDIRRSPEEVQQLIAQNEQDAAQAQQEANLVQAAGPASAAIKNLTQAAQNVQTPELQPGAQQ